MGKSNAEEVRQARPIDGSVRHLNAILMETKASSYSLEKKKVITRLVKQAKRRLWIFGLLNKVRLHKHNLDLLRHIRPILTLYATDRGLINETKKYLRELNKKSLNIFKSNIPSQSKIIIMVVGCNKYHRQLREALKQIRQEHTEMFVVGIVGKGGGTDWKIGYDKEWGILELPCSDEYEGLTEKVIWGCLAIELAVGGMAVLKVDEDTRSCNNKKLKKLAKLVQSVGAKAAGSPISVRTPLEIDRGWHLGKSSGKKNYQPFEGLGPKVWMSGGAGYLLMPEAVKTVGEFALHSWSFIQEQIYEDLTISWIVDSCCGKIYWIEEFSRTGIKNERAEDIIGGSTYHNQEQLKEDKRK